MIPRCLRFASVVIALLLKDFRCKSFVVTSKRAHRPAEEATRRSRNVLTPLHAHEEPPHNRAQTSHSTTSALTRGLEEASSQFQGLTVDEIQKKLVHVGFDYARGSSLSSSYNVSSEKMLASPIEKVSACIANVHVRTILEKSGDDSSYRITLEGTADALVSQGILAVLANVISHQRAEDVLLQLESSNLADRLGIRDALSPGRNDGLASMVRTIQKQVESLLLLHSNNANSAIKDTNVTSSQQGEIEQQRQKATSPTVALLLSGGVDSSVALNLLLRQGYNVTAFYLKIWLEDELAHLGKCPWEDDYRTCQAVCQQAGNVPLEAISLQQEYKERVISYTIQEAEQGRTPNPDILCNSRIKFGCFYDAIASRDFDCVATGHYAQLVRDEESTDRMRLLRAPDPVKDQSYFLCALSQEQLKRVLFPIGHLLKSQVRDLADEFQLPNRHRPDSQGLCFLGKVKFEEFLASYLGERPGKIIDASNGDILGQHRGIWYHTVGQRKGTGKVLDPLATSRGPWYVVAKDPENDIVFCSNEYDESSFTAARSQFSVENIQWIAGEAPSCFLDGDCSHHRLLMKIRHGPRIVEGKLTLSKAGTEGDVVLDEKDSGLAPGQYIVFYKENECLGGGVISERHWARFLLENRNIVPESVEISGASS